MFWNKKTKTDDEDYQAEVEADKIIRMVRASLHDFNHHVANVTNSEIREHLDFHFLAVVNNLHSDLDKQISEEYASMSNPGDKDYEI